MLVSRPATREYCWSGDLCTEPTGAVTRKESETVNKGRQQLLLTLILYYIKENCIFYHKIHTYLLMSLQCCVRQTVSTAQLPCMFSGHKYFFIELFSSCHGFHQRPDKISVPLVSTASFNQENTKWPLQNKKPLQLDLDKANKSYRGGLRS